MARKQNLVRVHESRGEYGADGASFNLDDFAQFDRYAASVAASNDKTHYRGDTLTTQAAGEGKVVHVTLFPRDYGKGEHAISLTAQLVTNHERGGCVFCDRHFNGAGNGTKRNGGK